MYAVYGASFYPAIMILGYAPEAGSVTFSEFAWYYQ